MCGIAGLVTRNGTPPDEGVLRRMAGSIAHRGPDGEGVWVAPGIGLAHRRLAIIDLSSAASQPMHDASGRFTIVFNGEIYNYRELRTELSSRGATFLNQSDTEVILEAYRVWGVDCLKRLRGMFAFAIWDAEKKSLFIARDRIGKKPLFTVMTPEGLAFASEIKSLANVVSLKPDQQAIRLFLGLQYVPSPLTGFDGVEQIPIGSYGMWDGKELKVETYHDFFHPRLRGDDSKGTIDQTIRQKLDDAVKVRQLASDVPVGAFLSGGIDSAAVVAFASKHSDRPLQTFTMGFPSLAYDERREAKELADHFHTDHHAFEARPEHLQELVDELIGHYDAPYADSSALPLWMLARETAKQIKVVLTGDGGDELFGGYRRYVAFAYALLMARIPMTPGVIRMANLHIQDPQFLRMAETIETAKRDPARAYGELFCGSYFSSASLRGTFSPSFLSETESSDAVGFVASVIASQTKQSQRLPRRLLAPRNDEDPLRSAMLFDLTSYLPDDLNVKMDRATMRFGLEARSPFLDQEMISYALSLPLNEKVSRGNTKVALRRALRGVVPDAVLTRKKKGFQVPLAEWFRGPLSGLIHDRLQDPTLPIARIVDQHAVDRLIEENRRGMDHGNRLWMLLSLSTWLQKYSRV